MAKLTADEKTILDMFQYMRPSGTPMEQVFIDRFLTPLGFTRDPFRNLVLTVGDRPNILWSSHMDTVHREEGIQPLHYDGEFLEIGKKAKSSTCLGADDTAGIWIMTEMVKAGVPGVYVIHHGEEIGCKGSRALAKGNPEFFEGIDAAIAFDRMGYNSVITHQMGARTASDAFSASFADALDDALGIDAGFKADDGGAYTDTNEYADIVSECTNISVGYHSQHSRNENQHVPFLIAMRNAMVRMDLSALVFARDPSVVDHAGSYGFYRGYKSLFDDDPWDNPDNYVIPDKRTGDSIEDVIKAYPEIVAGLLHAYGLTRTMLLDEIAEVYGEEALIAN